MLKVDTARLPCTSVLTNRTKAVSCLLMLQTLHMKVYIDIYRERGTLYLCVYINILVLYAYIEYVYIYHGSTCWQHTMLRGEACLYEVRELLVAADCELQVSRRDALQVVVLVPRCIYIFVYICMCIDICTRVYIYIYICMYHIFINANINMCVHIYIYIMCV